MKHFSTFYFVFASIILIAMASGEKFADLEHVVAVLIVSTICGLVSACSWEF